MDRLFLDANVLFSAAWQARSRLRSLWTLDGVTLVTSGYAAVEARRNLRDPARERRLDGLLESVETLGETTPEDWVPDSVELAEKDRPILAAAIASRSTHLLTGDFRHFGHLFGCVVSGVRIMRPAEYLRSGR